MGIDGTFGSSPTAETVAELIGPPSRFRKQKLRFRLFFFVCKDLRVSRLASSLLAPKKFSNMIKKFIYFERFFKIYSASRPDNIVGAPRQGH